MAQYIVEGTSMYNAENTTSRSHMEDLVDGEKFYVNGEEHTAVDSHYSGDASYDGYIVYDENGMQYFSDEFPVNEI